MFARIAGFLDNGAARSQAAAWNSTTRDHYHSARFLRATADCARCAMMHRSLVSLDEVESRRIASLLGPTIIVMIVAEFPLVQPHLYDAQIPPVVYLSGVLMFIGGLAIVRAHNRWRSDWTTLVTVSGWFALALGIVRMFAASA